MRNQVTSGGTELCLVDSAPPRPPSSSKAEWLPGAQERPWLRLLSGLHLGSSALRGPGTMPCCEPQGTPELAASPWL